MNQNQNQNQKCHLPEDTGRLGTLAYNSFRWRAIRLFNSLPKTIRDIKNCSVCSFKQRLDHYLSSIPDLHDIVSAYNKKGSQTQIDIAVLDFSKAFDTVPHDGLLSKLKHYGIDDKIWTWISNFLKQRKQRVVVDGIQSDLVTVDSGVPQGTVLGPILFLLHINDLPSVISSKVRLFADDCLVYREIKSRQDQNDLQKDLNLLESWGSTWGMRFNAAKCNIMRVSRKQTPIPYQYELSGQVLEEVKDA